MSDFRFSHIPKHINVAARKSPYCVFTKLSPSVTGPEIIRLSMVLVMEVKVFSNAHGDSLAVPFGRARTCHYITMTLCHYDNVII